jgi:hypothetical protein
MIHVEGTNYQRIKSRAGGRNVPVEGEKKVSLEKSY